MGSWKPKRRETLVAERFDKDLIVVDPGTSEVFTLEGVVATVYEQCEGEKSAVALAEFMAAELGLDAEQTVERALAEISRHGLFEQKMDEKAEPLLMSRRQLLGRGAVAAAISLPLIQTFLLPPPAFAATCKPSGSTCGNSAQCCSGLCMNIVMGAGTCA